MLETGETEAMWHKPAAFACSPDSPALELDGFVANVGGEGVVFCAFLLRRVCHGVKILRVKAALRTLERCLGIRIWGKISSDTCRVGPIGEGPVMTNPLHLAQLHSHSVSPPPRCSLHNADLPECSAACPVRCTVRRGSGMCEAHSPMCPLPCLFIRTSLRK